MFGVSKKSHKPTTFYALAFCIHLVAFILLCIGMFTPFWSEVKEQVGTTTTDVVYDKGLLVTCDTTNSCSGNSRVEDQSDVFFAAFILGIISIIHGFFVLQLFAAGICVRSCRETNLGIPVAIMSICEGALLILILILFELSIDLDTLPGNIHRDDDFGFSRGLIIGAIILYWLSAFFIIGEYMKRHDGPTPVQEYNEKGYSRKRGPPPQRKEYPQDRGYGEKPGYSSKKGPYVEAIPQAARGVVVPPPYTSRAGPVYYPEPEEQIYDSRNGMRACKLPGCHMCSYVAGSPTFWGPAGVFNINEHLTCQDKNIVYAVICVKDDKVFIGHSGRKLSDTFAEHLSNIKHMNRADPVAQHFTMEGHSNLDMRISGLARINCSPETRSRLERALSYDMDRPRNSYYGVNDDFEFI